MPPTSKSRFFPIFIGTLKPPFSTISLRLKIPDPSKNHQHLLPHLFRPISKNRFFQFFIKSENLNFRPREGYSGSNRCEIRTRREKLCRIHDFKHFLWCFFLELFWRLGRLFWAVLVWKSCLACRKDPYSSISTKDRWITCMFYPFRILKDP